MITTRKSYNLQQLLSQFDIINLNGKGKTKSSDKKFKT